MGRITSTSASRSKLFVAVLTAVLVFLMTARTPLDSDLFWHLRAGLDSLQSLHPVMVDTYSYTRAGSPWVNHSWLGQVLIALAYRGSGWIGLSTLVAALAMISMMLIYRRMSGPPLWRAFLVIFAVMVAAPVWSPRPQIFSLCLLVILDDLLERKFSRHVTWSGVILLFIFWSNLHGGYILGLILLLSRGVGEIIDRWAGRAPDPSNRYILEPFGLAMVGFLVAAINPNGTAMWGIPFQTVGVGMLQNAIPEWGSADFHDLTQQPFMWMLIGLLGALGLADRPARGRDLSKVSIFCAMGLVARRNFAPFALLALPLLSFLGWIIISRWINRLRVRPKFGGMNSEPPVWIQRTTNLVVFGVLVFAAMGKVYFVSHPAVVGIYLKEGYPAGAVEFLHMSYPDGPTDGNLFSTYAWGGYLTWDLPEFQVFVDGRTDLYGDEVIGEWLDIMGGKPGWEELLADHNVSLVLLEPGQPLVRELTEKGWQYMFKDETAVILERPK
jgi:hypothetical protein